MQRVSLPHEHGGWVTATAATLAAVVLAPAPAVALGVGLAVLASFVARGPVDRWAAHAALRRWDVAMVAALSVAVAAGAALVASRSLFFGAATLALAAGVLVASALARAARKQRAVIVETAGLAALGASAGLGLLAAGAPFALAASVALVLAGHAGASVPLVRSELRRRERSGARRAAGSGILLVTVAAALVTLVGQPALALALAPRAAHLVVRAARPPAASRPAWSALRETTLLAASVLLLVVCAV